MKKYFLLLAIIPGVFATASAQKTFGPFHHEVSIYGMGSVSTLLYSTKQAETKSYYHNNFGRGVGYTFFVNPNFGITTGAELSTYANSVVSNYLEDKKEGQYEDLQTIYPETWQFITEYVGYEEKQTVTYLHIPLMVQFKTIPNSAVFPQNSFYGAIGAKVGIAMEGEYRTTATSLTTAAHLDVTDVRVEDILNHNFTTKNNPMPSTGKLTFGLDVALAAEVGVCWGIIPDKKSANEKILLYTGIYADYGLLDVAPKKTEQPLVDVATTAAPGDFVYNSITTAQHQSSGTPYVNSINLFSCGVKLKLSFGF